MALTRWACSHCGHWHRWFADRAPPLCLVCSDIRNALPDDGFEFLGVEQVAACLRTVVRRDVLPGIHAVHAEPAFGLGSIGWIVECTDGNVGFEAAPFYRDDTLDTIAALGGLRAVACSHPHGMGALWMLQERFDPVVHVHVDTVPWTHAFRVTWPVDDRHEIAPGLTLHHVGGHYEGQLVMHDAAHRALFAGDTLKIDLDTAGRPRALSCHKAYPYRIPLSHGELRRYRRVYTELPPFDHVFTPFEHAAGVTRAHALALFDRLLAGPPTTDPVALESLE